MTPPSAPTFAAPSRAIRVRVEQPPFATATEVATTVQAAVDLVEVAVLALDAHVDGRRVRRDDLRVESLSYGSPVTVDLVLNLDAATIAAIVSAAAAVAASSATIVTAVLDRRDKRDAAGRADAEETEIAEAVPASTPEAATRAAAAVRTRTTTIVGKVTVEEVEIEPGD